MDVACVPHLPFLLVSCTSLLVLLLVGINNVEPAFTTHREADADFSAALWLLHQEFFFQS